jgi:hypothetical protein
VFVDGQRFDDRAARAVQEDTPGHDAAGEVKLGHRVEIEFEQDDIARTLRIEATLAGTVTSANTAQLVVLGQTVRVNADPAKGPVTQFGGGYTVAADVKPGDVVEVHGIVVSQGQGSIVQATRIEKEDALPPFLKVTGTVSDLAAGTFSLGSLAVTTANATILPAGAALANGQVVRVMAPPAALSGSTLAATQVRIKALPRDGHTAVVSGAVGALDTAGRTFLVGTQKVDYSAATLVPTGTALANGQYVRVRGQLGSDGTLMATQGWCATVAATRPRRSCTATSRPSMQVRRPSSSATCAWTRAT